MQSRVLSLSHYTRRIAAKPTLWVAVIGLAGFGLVTTTPQAHATAYPPSTSACSYSNATTTPNATGVTGVTPGSAITISCAAGSFPANSGLLMLEASGLAGIVSPASAELNEVDLFGAGVLQGAKAGPDGSLSTTYTVPSSAYKAPDSQATCPPTQAQINVGLTCDLIIASGLTPQNVAMIVYQGQGTPNAPTLHTTFTIDRGVKTLTESDVPGACTIPVTATSRCWWGAPVTGAPNKDAFTGIPGFEAQVSKVLATNDLTVSPAVYCQTGATAAACSGLAPGTLVPPQLSGTATTSLGLQPVLVDEPNTTPYTGNGTLPAVVPGSSNVEAAQTGPPVRG